MLTSLVIYATACLGAREDALRSQQPYWTSAKICSDTGVVTASSGPALAELPDGRLICAWSTAGKNEAAAGARISASVLLPGADAWEDMRVLAEMPDVGCAFPALWFSREMGLHLYFARAENDGSFSGPFETVSKDGGYTWSTAETLCSAKGMLPVRAMAAANGLVWLAVHDSAANALRFLLREEAAAEWTLTEPAGAGLVADAPGIFARADGTLGCWFAGGDTERVWSSVSSDFGRTWSEAVATRIPHYDIAPALLRLSSGNLLALLKTRPGNARPLTALLSADDGGSSSASRLLPEVFAAQTPCLLQGQDEIVHVAFFSPDGGLTHVAMNEAWLWARALCRNARAISAAAASPTVSPPTEPAAIAAPFEEHVRGFVSGVPEGEITDIKVDAAGQLLAKTEPRATLADKTRVNALIELGGLLWYGTDTGLYAVASENDAGIRQEAYGIAGPLASHVTALAVDSAGTLWVGTPLGLSLLSQDKTWRHVRAKDGLPVEDVTALAIDEQDRVWIGSSRGAILYLPKAQGRQWFYRAGKRYLPGDQVKSIALAQGGMPAYFLTENGIGRLDAVTVTLEQRARLLEQRLNERHRRSGFVGSCVVDNPDIPTSHEMAAEEDAGVPTAFHAAAMSLCYAVTGDAEAKRSSSESMQALYTLQNASGTGIPAGLDVFACYTYYEHVARFDPAELDSLEAQVRLLADYAVHQAEPFLAQAGESASELGRLELLAALKTAQYITGDDVYYDCYRRLIEHSGFLEDLLLDKALATPESTPLECALAAAAWYPLLQIERDPLVRGALLRAAGCDHERARERGPVFATLAYAAASANYADVPTAIERLRTMPTNRRHYAVVNSTRDDLAAAPSTAILPEDERPTLAWNQDPATRDAQGDGRTEDDGTIYLLPYWLARYHQFIAPTTSPQP